MVNVSQLTGKSEIIKQGISKSLKSNHLKDANKITKEIKVPDIAPSDLPSLEQLTAMRKQGANVYVDKNGLKYSVDSLIHSAQANKPLNNANLTVSKLNIKNKINNIPSNQGQLPKVQLPDLEKLTEMQRQGATVYVDKNGEKHLVGSLIKSAQADKQARKTLYPSNDLTPKSNKISANDVQMPSLEQLTAMQNRGVNTFQDSNGVSYTVDSCINSLKPAPYDKSQHTV